ncbi:MAG: hypothetical protein IKB00_10650 [Bacteroidaceae bacterium]|nr:hypothetical protein [Bacteroidaceae bacterium]
MRTVNYLSHLTEHSILSGTISMDRLIKDSVFYPACEYDGTVLKTCNELWSQLGITSFIYADYASFITEEDLIRELSNVCGYHVVGHRSLRPEEYRCPGWKLDLAETDENNYMEWFGDKSQQWAHWAVFERDNNRNSQHGPKRFSFLFIHQEGLKTFQELYCSRGVAPKMVCWIQCWGFAGNWFNPTRRDGSFLYTLRKHPECIPEYILCGNHLDLHPAQKIKGVQELGIRSVGYDIFSKEPCINVDDSMTRNVKVLEHNGRQYLKLTSSYHMGPVVYDITDSQYNVNKIVDSLLLQPQRTNFFQTL